MYKTTQCAGCGKPYSNSTPNCPWCGHKHPDAVDDEENGENDEEGNVEFDDDDDEGPTARPKGPTPPKAEAPQMSGGMKRAIAEAARDGAALAAIEETNLVFVKLTKAALVSAGVPALMLEDNKFLERGVPIISALIALYLAETFPDMVPRPAFVSKAARLSLTVGAKDTIQPLMALAAPALMSLAASGEKLAVLEASRKRDELGEDAGKISITTTDARE